MFASKSLLLIVPAALVALPLAASAQDAARPGNAPATTPPTKTSTEAMLTTPARPASAIAPRQSLTALAPAKTKAAPLADQPAAPPNAVAPNAATPATVASSLPPVPKTPVGATKLAFAPNWSQREKATLTAPQPLAAPLSKPRARRTYTAAVSAATSPLAPVVATPKTTDATNAPATALTPVAALAPKPQTEVAPQTEAAPQVAARQGAQLASREARARELRLARLDAQLAAAEGRLDRAQSRLTQGQKQLGSVTNLLQNAIITQGAGARGLHPFVRVAQRYLGTPYVWGGESARGFDCSGFIMRVMRDLGYKALPHSAAEQFNYGKPIAKPFLQPGDIVFFANTYKPGISHVGIYLGKGRFIHAANSQVGTIVSSLNEPKWIEKYAGARRLMKVG